jgi:hypothetical protein
MRFRTLAALAFVIALGLYAFRDDPAAPTAADADKAGPDAACRAEVACWAAHWAHLAESRCPERIERLARYAVRWTDGMLEPKFSRAKWADEAAGSVTWAGDRVEFQNGFGAWEPQIYTCTLDPAAPDAVEVTAQPGRL